MNPNPLIQRYLLGVATPAEIAELDRLLEKDANLRQQLILEAKNDSYLRQIALERAAEPTTQEGKKIRVNFLSVGIKVAAAAVVTLLLVVASTQWGQPDLIATLVSNENAAWESSLPTLPQSRLSVGSLKLKSGVSTIRFDSGALVVLEAPAELELLSPMRGKLLNGSAVIEVPESAHGFVIETPDGYAVDYGTQFSVRVANHRSDFELIDGEIAVHHPDSGKELRLTEQGSAATVSAQALRLSNAEDIEVVSESRSEVIRIRTNGRQTSVRRHPSQRPIPTDVLLARRNNSGDRNAHCFFAFNLSEIEFDQIESAQLRLNLVPGRGGFAARLPKINRFAVHGLIKSEKSTWTNTVSWDEAPQPEDGELLGTFEIPRSQKRGSFGIRTTKLLDFLKAHRGDVTLILSRETKFIAGAGKGMTHLFASENHPEAVGPTLEFTLKPRPRAQAAE